MANEHQSTWPETTAGCPLTVEHLLKVSAEKTLLIAELEGLLREYFNHWNDEAPIADDIGVRAAKVFQKLKQSR